VTPVAPDQDREEDLDGVPISEVARRLGVPMPTLRSWESRYGIPENARALGKHRRYSPGELHSLRLMRDEVARGKRASLAAESVRQLLAGSAAASPFIADILSASERAEPAAVQLHLSRAQAVLGLGPCLDDVLLPAMQQIGLWWQSGRCDIAQEHLTTEAARAWLETVRAQAPPPARSAPVILACGPTDHHTIGLESLGILLRYRQQACRLLGARTSIGALAAAFGANGAQAVVIVSHLSSGRARAVLALRAMADLGIATFFAGNAFNSPRSRRNVPGTYLGSNLQQAVLLIQAAPD
jgi:DNA-binding transcriptional MerR regulator